ncbi:hypothetical protein, partial [Streptomyces rishiriensis]|uniref:hypothetical protein n=1 Tax=Streptomyces rishiriensis TaxID=68264 RepID=UPI0037D17EDA
KPHLTETFKLSTDPLFVEKVYDVVGLYFDPPAGSLSGRPRGFGAGLLTGFGLTFEEPDRVATGA